MNGLLLDTSPIGMLFSLRRRQGTLFSASFLKLVIVALIAITLNGCTKDDNGHSGSPDIGGLGANSNGGEKKDDGGETGAVDGGGGTTTTSSPQMVREAIDRALRLASEPNFKKNPIARFFHERFYFLFWKRMNLARQIFPHLPELPEILTNAKEAPKSAREDYLRRMTAMEYATKLEENLGRAYVSEPLLAVRKNKIIYLESGDCESPTHDHADASVTELNTNATLCFSIGNLTRIAPSSLLQEILSLVLHEAAHMGGANETDAKTWQELFSSFYSARFAHPELINGNSPMTASMNRAQDQLHAAMAMNSKSPGDPKVFYWMGQFVETLSTMPQFPDELQIDLIEQPKSPQLIPTFITSVIAVTTKASKSFGIVRLPLTIDMTCNPKTDSENCPDLLAPSPKRTDAEWTIIMKELDAMMDQAQENRVAMMIGTDTAVCMAPEKPFNIEDILFNFEQMTGFGPVFSELTCSKK